MYNKYMPFYLPYEMEDVCYLLCTVMSDSNLIFFSISLALDLDCSYHLWIVYDRVIYSPITDFNTF